MAKVAIVSAFGRGEYLAERLVEQGLDVQFIDLSHLFQWPEAQWDGPFALMQSSRLSENAWRWLERNWQLDESRSGYTVFSKNGAFEFRGSVIEHRVKSLNMASEILHTPARGFNTPFPQSWLLRSLIFGSRSVEYSPAFDLKSAAFKFPDESLVQRLFYRHKKIPLVQRGTKVQVLSGYKVEDVAISNRNRVEGLLLKQERSEMIEVDQLVWALSSSETLFLNPVLNDKLFSGEARESVYSWICYDVEMSHVEYLPPFFVWIEDPEMPWSHQYYMTFRRTGSGQYQVWLKMPTSHRFLSTSLEVEERTWVAAFEARIPKLKVKMVKRPLEANQETKTLGPSPFCTYREGTLQKRIEIKSPSLHFLNNEISLSLLPQSSLEQEEKIEAVIGSWWQHEQMILNKKKMRESKL